MSSFSEIRKAYKIAGFKSTPSHWTMSRENIRDYDEGQSWCCGVDVLVVSNGVLELHRCNKGRGGNPSLSFVPADGGERVPLIEFDQANPIHMVESYIVLKLVQTQGLEWVMNKVERHMLEVDCLERL